MVAHEYGLPLIGEDHLVRVLPGDEGRVDDLRMEPARSHERQHLGNHCPRVHTPGHEADPAGVHLEQRQGRLEEVDRDGRADPVGLDGAEGAGECGRIRAPVYRDGERACAARRRALDAAGAEPLRDRQPLAIVSM